MFYACPTDCSEAWAPSDSTPCVMARVGECAEFPLNDVLPIDQYVTITSGHKLHWLPSQSGNEYTIRMYDGPNCVDSSIHTVLSESLREDERYGSIIKTMNLKDITLQLSITGELGVCAVADFSGTQPAFVGAILPTLGLDAHFVFSERALSVRTTGTASTPSNVFENPTTAGPSQQGPREPGAAGTSTRPPEEHSAPSVLRACRCPLSGAGELGERNQ